MSVLNREKMRQRERKKDRHGWAETRKQNRGKASELEHGAAETGPGAGLQNAGDRRGCRRRRFPGCFSAAWWGAGGAWSRLAAVARHLRGVREQQASWGMKAWLHWPSSSQILVLSLTAPALITVGIHRDAELL